MFMILILFSLALFTASLAGAWMKEKDTLAGVIALFFAYVLMVMSAFTAYMHGVGEIDASRLKPNAIYETLSSVPNNGKYVAILRDQDGGLSARFLNTDPPPLFKYVDQLENPYQAILLIPVTSIKSGKD